MKKYTTEEFIERSKKVHGENKYDYSKVNYISSKDKVIIICNKCKNEFIQTAHNHLCGQGCPNCKGGVKYTQEQFIEKVREIHGDRYGYNKVNYINSSTPVILNCDIHGDFEIKPVDILQGCGCKECNPSPYKKYTTESFIEAAKKVHGEDKYDYSEVNYVNINTPVKLICNKCKKEFTQRPHDHLYGHGCSECNGGVNINTEEFIRRAKLIHKDTYGYDEVEYVNCTTPVKIICNSHGPFWQQPSIHLSNCGCPSCGDRFILEVDIELYCKDNNINIIKQYTWDWLKYKRKQHVDFYLPDFNAVIECQGLQHFKPTEFFDKKYTFEERVKMDDNKRNLCLEHGLRVFYYSNIIKTKSDSDFEYPYKVYENLDELFKEIKNLSD